MISKPLVLTALAFQIIGMIWDAIYHFTDPDGIGEFFGAAHWPLFLGFVLLLVAVIQSYPRKPKPENKSENSQS